MAPRAMFNNNLGGSVPSTIGLLSRLTYLYRTSRHHSAAVPAPTLANRFSVFATAC